MSESLEELLAKFDGLEDIIMQGAFEGVRDFDQRVQLDAKDNVRVITGRLRNSITTKEEVNETKITGAVGTNVEYAAAVEFGTGPVGAASNTDYPSGVNVAYRDTGWVYKNKDGDYRYTRGQPAKPYLYPAFKENAPDANGLIAKAVKKKLEEAANAQP